MFRDRFGGLELLFCHNIVLSGLDFIILPYSAGAPGVSEPHPGAELSLIPAVSRV